MAYADFDVKYFLLFGPDSGAGPEAESDSQKGLDEADREAYNIRLK
jgi:hypothetical protein